MYQDINAIDQAHIIMLPRHYTISATGETWAKLKSNLSDKELERFVN